MFIALKKKVAASTEFAEMSKKFVMVNSEVKFIKICSVAAASLVWIMACIIIFLFPKDDEEPDYDELFDIDGTYVPRTFFIGKLKI